MKLLVISNPEQIPGEATLINQLLAAGLELFHLRKPKASVTDMERLLNKVNPEFYPAIALHQHHNLAKQFGIKRLHFPEHQRQQTPVTVWQQLLEEGYKVTTSVHAIDTLTVLPPVWEYVFFSPVFTSISKPGYAPVLPPAFYLTECNKPFPVIALGGITSRNLNQIPNMNFNGAAVLGAIWRQPHKAVAEFSKLKEICRRDAPTC